MTCVIQKNITIEKLLNYDLKNICNIKKLIVKWGEDKDDECYFDFMKQSNLFKKNKIYNIPNLDILSLFYTFIKSSFYSLITDKYYFEEDVFPNSPIPFKKDSIYNLDSENINNIMIIREIFRLCEYYKLKIWIEIEMKDGLIIYKDD